MYEHPRLFLLTVKSYGGASAPFGLSNVVPPLGGGTPTYIILNVPIVYNIILIVREIVVIVREILIL